MDINTVQDSIVQDIENVKKEFLTADEVMNYEIDIPKNEISEEVRNNNVKYFNEFINIIKGDFLKETYYEYSSLPYNLKKRDKYLIQDIRNYRQLKDLDLMDSLFGKDNWECNETNITIRFPKVRVYDNNGEYSVLHNFFLTFEYSKFLENYLGPYGDIKMYVGGYLNNPTKAQKLKHYLHSHIRFRRNPFEDDSITCVRKIYDNRGEPVYHQYNKFSHSCCFGEYIADKDYKYLSFLSLISFLPSFVENESTFTNPYNKVTFLQNIGDQDVTLYFKDIPYKIFYNFIDEFSFDVDVRVDHKKLEKIIKDKSIVDISNINYNHLSTEKEILDIPLYFNGYEYNYEIIDFPFSKVEGKKNIEKSIEIIEDYIKREVVTRIENKSIRKSRQ